MHTCRRLFANAAVLSRVRSYSLTYERWCARDGLMQQTARAIDDVGEAVSIGNITARNRNVLIPNAPLLRAAEGLDALTYAFYSSEQNTPHEAAGYLLCAMVSAPLPCTFHCAHSTPWSHACALRSKWAG